MKKNYLIEFIYFLYILLFLYAGGIKLWDYNRFVGELGKSPLITRYSEWLAWFVPSLEIAIVILLMIPRYRLRAMQAATGLMILFTLYIAVMLSLYEELPCACGGVISGLQWQGHLLFNLMFVILGCACIWLCINYSRGHSNFANPSRTYES